MCVCVCVCVLSYLVLWWPNDHQDSFPLLNPKGPAGAEAAGQKRSVVEITNYQEEKFISLTR